MADYAVISGESTVSNSEIAELGIYMQLDRPNPTPSCFTAIDFETADYEADSACAVGLVKVVGDQIVKKERFLIRPPRPSFVFTYIHGIDWVQVAREPTFKELWPVIRDMLTGVDFIAAHNARFDQGVLYASCKIAGLDRPDPRFVCTVKLSRKVWGPYPTKLPNVCDHLGIQLKHHDPLSDAEACARIVIAAMKTGYSPPL
ncbi:MAG: 3'-5' exonuclease [Nitrospira sp.]